MIRWLQLGFALAAGAGVAGSVNAAEPPPIQLVANESVPTGAVSRKSLQAIFRGESAQWTDGTPLKPVDQSVRSEVRSLFTREILNDTLQGIQAHWMRRISQGRGLPPPVKGSDAEVLAFVGSNRGALGYIAADTPLVAGVKRVALID